MEGVVHSVELMNRTCRDFVQALAAREAIPGGGGASALAGALGAALGSMVGNLTLGKKKYAAVQKEIDRLIRESNLLCEELLVQVELDAQAFLPLSRAYALPRENGEQKRIREETLERALAEAARPPLEIMRLCCRAIELLERYAETGASIAISDAGVGAALCRAALRGAALNLYVNAKGMRDRTLAAELERQAEQLLAHGETRAEQVYHAVLNKVHPAE